MNPESLLKQDPEAFFYLALVCCCLMSLHAHQELGSSCQFGLSQLTLGLHVTIYPEDSSQIRIDFVYSIFAICEFVFIERFGKLKQQVVAKSETIAGHVSLSDRRVKVVCIFVLVLPFQLHPSLRYSSSIMQ